VRRAGRSGRHAGQTGAMEKVRWGVLSTSDFAERKFIPGLQKSPLIEVAAVGSRDLGKARSFAERCGIATAYGSYEELLADRRSM
jgi:predicted dehydrogenase